jgi:LPS export ABC transporter protein LptC
MNKMNLTITIIYIGIISILIFGCEEKIKPTTISDINTVEAPTQESWNNKIIFSDSGKTAAILKAGHIQYYATKAEYLLKENVQVDFYNRNGEHSSILTADEAKVDDKTRNMWAFGHVRVVSDSGTTVTTERMFWTNDTRKISGDQFVTITSKKETIQGYGFESDQNLKDYTIKRVSGEVSSGNLTK